MTEDDAKMKWCPFARAASDGGNTAWNRLLPGTAATPDIQAAANCLGSACMAWRTRHQWLDNAQEAPDWVNYLPYAFEPGEGQERDDGYCGLAGAPQ